MDLNSLKQKATAGELCLINQVEKCLKEEAKAKTLSKAIEFIRNNMPPSREEIEMRGREVFARWFEKFSDYISSQP